MPRFAAALLTPLVLSLVCCDQRPAITFEEFKKEFDATVARANSSRATLSAVSTDLRFGSGGRWILVAVPPSGFSEAAAIEQGLSAEEAGAVRAAQPASRSARFVYLGPEGVSVLDVEKGLVNVPQQRVVVGRGVSWLSLSLEIRGNEVPELALLQSSKSPP